MNKSRLEIRLNAFRRSAIPQTQFIIIISSSSSWHLAESLRGEISVTEKLVLTTQLSIVEYRRDKKLGIYIWRTFSHVAETASCLWTKQTYLGKCSDENLRTSTLVNDGTIRSTTDFASALNNVDNVKISDLLEFLVMLLFFSLYSHPKIICRELQD